MVRSRMWFRLFQPILGLAVSSSALVLLGGTAAAATEVTAKTPEATSVIVQTTAQIHESSSAATGRSNSGLAPDEAVTSVSFDNGTAAAGGDSQVARPLSITSSAASIETETTGSGVIMPPPPVRPDEPHSNVVPAGPVAVDLPGNSGPVAPAGPQIRHYDVSAMPLQPVVMAAPPIDLAVAVPTSLSHDPSNQPAPTTLSLSGLMLGLSQVVVPGIVFLLPAIGAGTFAADLEFAMAVILLGLLTLTYGLWLRRSGFSTAARSDLPAAFTFASPRLMGYVRVHIHPRT